MSRTGRPLVRPRRSRPPAWPDAAGPASGYNSRIAHPFPRSAMRLPVAPLALACSFLLATGSLGGPPQGDKGVLQMSAEDVALAYQQNEAFVDEYLTSKAIQ